VLRPPTACFSLLAELGTEPKLANEAAFICQGLLSGLLEGKCNFFQTWTWNSAGEPIESVVLMYFKYNLANTLHEPRAIYASPGLLNVPGAMDAMARSLGYCGAVSVNLRYNALYNVPTAMTFEPGGAPETEADFWLEGVKVHALSEPNSQVAWDDRDLVKSYLGGYPEFLASTTPNHGWASEANPVLVVDSGLLAPPEPRELALQMAVSLAAGQPYVFVGVRDDPQDECRLVKYRHYLQLMKTLPWSPYEKRPGIATSTKTPWHLHPYNLLCFGMEEDSDPLVFECAGWSGCLQETWQYVPFFMPQTYWHGFWFPG
jgi:hypothetical protein